MGFESVFFNAFRYPNACIMGTAIGPLLEKREISLSDLSGKWVGVDSYNILYQFLSSIRSPDGTAFTDSQGRVTSHLIGLLYRTTNLVDKGLKLVFVFDGVPPQLKRDTLRKRSEIRTQAIAAHEQALKEGDLEEAKRLGGRALRLTKEMVADAKSLVELLGFPAIQAPSEGEAQIARLCELGKLQGCASQDFDALLFGTPILYRNIGITGKRKAPGRNVFVDVVPEQISLQQNLDALKIDRRKLVWLSMLIGTDFNEKFPNIGPKKALKLVQENDSFESIIKAAKFNPPFDFQEVEDLFLKPNVNDHATIEFHPPNREKVLHFLVEERGFSKERVSSALEKLSVKAEEKGSQATLGKWFG